MRLMSLKSTQNTNSAHSFKIFDVMKIQKVNKRIWHQGLVYLLNKIHVHIKSMTHLCMNGRPSLHVQDYDSFYVEYVNKVKNGEKLYLVETKTPLFRFFIDYDFTSEKKLERSEIVEIVRKINSFIPGRCVCAVSSPKIISNGVKSGIHIHFPDLIVTKQKAIRLRSELPDDIRQFVDESVYKGSGLRMLWSYKKDGGSPYLPLYDVQNDSWLDQHPSVDMLKLFSIKTAYTIGVDEMQSVSCTLLEEFIHKYIPGHETTAIKGISKNILRTDSKYCERIRREHKSNHVYFVIDGSCIYQRCYDIDCKKFCGRKYKLTPSALDDIKNLPSES